MADKMRYVEECVTDMSIGWGGGHTDPRGVLKPNVIYAVERTEKHAWHTRIYLIGIKGYFNSVWFEEVESED